MSRIGNRVLEIPTGVSVEVKKENSLVLIKGKNGEITVPFNDKIISVLVKDEKVFVKRTNDEKFSKMLHGTINSNINNAMIGVNVGHLKVLKIIGVGYKANVVGANIELALGYSHLIRLAIPKSTKVECPTPTEVRISGPDKSIVGEFAAIIRSKRPPEPYKGKGVMYINEEIIRKAGKTAESSKK
ncbi:MAG: 50S ribosomal protein L6 [Malacoplasma sp.]